MQKDAPRLNPIAPTISDWTFYPRLFAAALRDAARLMAPTPEAAE